MFHIPLQPSTHPSAALHTRLKDRGRSQTALPLPRKSCPQALSQAAAGRVFEVESTSHTPAPPAVWFILEGDPCQKGFTISRQQRHEPPDLSVQLSPTRSHPNSTKWGRRLKNEGTLLHQELLKVLVYSVLKYLFQCSYKCSI